MPQGDPRLQRGASDFDPQRSADLLRGGDAVAVQAAAMYRVDHLRSVADFDVNLNPGGGTDPCTLARRIATHDNCVAEYRYSKRLMLVRSMVGPPRDNDNSGNADIAPPAERGLLFHHNAPHLFAAATRELIKDGWNSEAAKMMFRTAKMAPFTLLGTIMSRCATSIVRRLPRPLGQLFGEALWAPGVGSVRFGDFGRTKPISADYGSDRGTPIDRYYIERALKDFSKMVHGRVLEVGGRDYTREFGAGRIASSDVLDINPLNPLATVVGDLGVVGALPESAFDCIILTQTLQLIYNLDNAMENLYRALAPGGALLITVPGISPIGPEEMTYWYWTFTDLSLKTLLSDRFAESNVQVQSHGNVFAAICFLTGLSLAEIEAEKLDLVDKGYPVTVFACARKPS